MTMDITYNGDMMTVYGRPIKETQGALLSSVNYAEAIEGLNGYFTSEPRNDYITIRRQIDSYTFFLYDPEKWADILISWLRTEHGIFYYPGMEAKYVKAEKRIPPFTERMKNEGALRTLKKLHKIVTGEQASDKADSPTLIAAAIETDFAVLRKDLNNALESKESFFETKGKLAYRKELMDYIVNSEKKYDIRFSDLHDDEEFRPERIFDDLLDKMAHNEHILKDLYRDILHKQPDDLSNEDIATKILNKVFEMQDDFAKSVKARAEYVESISRNTEKSDINKLISDYCNKFDIIAPSTDSSDKACVEYLFSVVDLERKHRAAVGKQMVDNYEKDLLQFIYKEYSNRTHLSNETVTYDPPSVHNTIIKIIRDYARSRTRVDILETRIKSIFDKHKTKFTVDDYIINGNPTISFMLDCIWSWIGSSTELKEKCDFLETDLGKTAVIREFLNRRSKTRTKLGTIERKLEDLLKDVKEELQ